VQGKEESNKNYRKIKEDSKKKRKGERGKDRLKEGNKGRKDKWSDSHSLCLV
jgi:hypothetical protein